MRRFALRWLGAGDNDGDGHSRQVIAAMARSDQNAKARVAAGTPRHVALKPLLDLVLGPLPALAHRRLQLIPALLELATHAGGPVASLPSTPAAAQLLFGSIPRPPGVVGIARLLPTVTIAVADVVPGGVGVLALPLRLVIGLAVLPAISRRLRHGAPPRS